MANQKWVPDIVVGIDFGMTCTGVAYSWGPDWPDPKTVQQWPGKMVHELANKVPTILQYGSSRIVKAWGFDCDEASEDADIFSCFKLHLDPGYLDPSPQAYKTEDARRWFRDYLHCLHCHIDEIFSNSFPRWKSQRTEFIFSVPTTWKTPSMIAEIETIIKDAGFGKDNSHHRAEIGLTEAEAAAVYASKHQFEDNDIILVCDAGGGTTDVNVLKMTCPTGKPSRLQQLSWVEGRPIGSTLIDMEFHQIISARLVDIRLHLLGEPEDIAELMMQDRFEGIKCSFGTSAASRMPTIAIPIPGLTPGQNFPHLHIENASMIFSKEDLVLLFDNQVNRMLALINRQLENMHRNHPGAKVSYLVLSGGLGSSPYVRQCLKSHYESTADPLKPSAHDLKVIVAAEPQIAVVHGLVIDRVQALHRGEAVLRDRCCRLSYGVRVQVEYNPENPAHRDQKTFLDDRDGKRWVKDQIEWLVKQGETVSSKGLLKPCTVRIDPGKEGSLWQAFIVMSTADRKSLPTNIDQADVSNLCTLSSSLRLVPLKMKNRHWYNVGTEFLRADFDLKVVFGAADIKFQLLTKSGKVVSDNHDDIEVKWEPSG